MTFGEKAEGGILEAQQKTHYPILILFSAPARHGVLTENFNVILS